MSGWLPAEVAPVGVLVLCKKQVGGVFVGFQHDGVWWQVGEDIPCAAPLGWISLPPEDEKLEAPELLIDTTFGKWFFAFGLISAAAICVSIALGHS